MKSLLVLVVLAGVVFTFTEGFAIETQKTKALKKCQEAKIDKLLNQIITDTYNLKTEAYDVYDSARSSMMECVLDSFTTLVSCVQGVVQDSVQEVEDDVDTYLNTVQKLATKVAVYMEDCV